MIAAVVFESLFGNTHEIAEAIADGLMTSDPEASVTVIPAADAGYEILNNVDLLVVGCPTHILRMPTSRTRNSGIESARKAGEPVTSLHTAKPGFARSGVREWLEELPDVGVSRHGAAFDTRLANPMAGGASRTIARRLRRRGYTIDSDPQGFIVEGGEGPLRPGQWDRARNWGAELGRYSALRVIA
jgi:hypothetical protein